MNIGILIFSLPRDERPANAARLVEAARQRGHVAICLYEPFLAFYDDGTVTHEGDPLPDLDVIIARPNFIEEPSLHTLTTDALVQTGHVVVNAQPTFSLSKNKLAQHARLTREDIPMPRWAIARMPDEAMRAAERIGYPLIVKVAFGTWGKGVFYAENPETLVPIVDYLNVRDGNPVIIQEFVAEAGRKDLRALVVGGRVIAAMERTARPNDVRANASIGGSARAIELDEADAALAFRAADAFDLEIAGVDLIRSSRGTLVLEVNANPGFSKIEEVTGIDVAGAIIDCAVRKAGG